MTTTLIFITKFLVVTATVATGEAGGEYIASVVFNAVSSRLGLWIDPQ